MAYSVEMPALGESVTEGTVTRWLKQEGDTVAVDEPLLEVSTDKVDTEIPSPAAGVLQKILVPEDGTVEVGAQLAVIGDGSGGDSSAGDGSAPQQEDSADAGAAEQDDEDEAPADENDDPDVAARQEPEQQEPEQQEPEQQESDEDPEQEETRSEPEPAQDGGSKGGGDSTPVTMPALGESVTEGTVTRWLKQVGDSVDADEPLLEVSTDKVDTEIPAPVAGTVLEISVQADETVEVGAQLAVIGSGDAAPAQQSEPEPEPDQDQEAPPQKQKQKQEQEQEQEQEAPQQKQEVPPQQEEARSEPEPAQPAQADEPSGGDTNGASPYVTPLVRKLAAEHGVDLATVKGTGVGGRIRKQDVLAAVEAEPEPEPPAQEEERADQPAAAAPAASAPAQSVPASKQAEPSSEVLALRGRTEKLSRMRKIIATRMVESLQISAQLTTTLEVDVSRIALLRSRAQAEFTAREGVKLTFLPFFAKACVEALKVHPRVNSSLDIEAGTVTYHDAEHLGIAVDTERGLLVPVIHDAGDLNIAGLARRISDIADRTRNNKVSPDEMTGGTFTLTNTGSRGALFDTPIINQPQVGILGTGAVVKRPVVLSSPEGDTIAVRSMMFLALSYDHRIVDGADAARFLTTIKERLEEGAFEADLGL